MMSLTFNEEKFLSSLISNNKEMVEKQINAFNQENNAFVKVEYILQALDPNSFKNQTIIDIEGVLNQGGYKLDGIDSEQFKENVYKRYTKMDTTYIDDLTTCIEEELSLIEVKKMEDLSKNTESGYICE